jgi:hypothetical protein
MRRVSAPHAALWTAFGAVAGQAGANAEIVITFLRCPEPQAEN